MNQMEIGKFIAKCRKEKNLTQAQLAQQLNITDRAVSKWETGKSVPDSSIMLELCRLLGITVNELLSGEKVDKEHYEKRADENLIALKQKDENNIKRNAVLTVIFSATLLVGILVCGICDFAVSGRLTWSLLAINSILLAWVVSMPVILLGKRGVPGSLLSASLFILPYLFLLGRLVGERAVFSIGALPALMGAAYLWSVFGIFHRLAGRRLLAGGMACLLCVPAVVLVNLALSQTICQPVMDLWDWLSVFLLVMAALAFFICDYTKGRRLIRG